MPHKLIRVILYNSSFFFYKDYRKECGAQPEQSLSRSGNSLPVSRKQVSVFCFLVIFRTKLKKLKKG